MVVHRCRAGVLLSLLTVALLITPRTAATAQEWQPDPKLAEAARKEGEAIWYTTLIVDQIVRPLIKEFQARVPGVDIKFVRAESTALVVRLTNEARAGQPQSDLWCLLDGVESLIEQNIAAPLDLPSARSLPATLYDPGRHWVATNLASRSLAYNTTLIPKDQAPRNYQDLLDPRWKGKFAWHQHAMAGAWGFIATVLKYMGDDAGMAYLRKLAKQEIVPLNISTRAVLDRVIAGEYPMGLEMVNAHVALSVAKGAPVAWVPLDAVSTTLQAAGLTANAMHPNAARLFLDFVVSKTGQNIFRERNYIPMHPDVPAKQPELKAEQGGYNSIVFGPDEIDKNAPRYAKVYEEIFR
jgi:iron(III) transport system substrate-binding protein